MAIKPNPNLWKSYGKAVSSAVRNRSRQQAADQALTGLAKDQDGMSRKRMEGGHVPQRHIDILRDLKDIALRRLRRARSVAQGRQKQADDRFPSASKNFMKSGLPYESTNTVRKARMQLAENVLNELSPMLLRRARNKAMGIARADRDVSKSFAYHARQAAERFAKGDDAANRDRIVQGALSDDFANNSKKKVGQAKKFNKGMVKRRKQLKAVVDEPNEPKKKTDAPYEVPPYRTDQFADGTGKYWNRGKKPPMN